MHPSISLMTALFLCSTTALAGGKKSKNKDKQSSDSFSKAPYGMAGCGLGSILISSNTTGPQILAVTLNATGYQTSGMTTGTSNCVESRTETAAMEQSVYVTANLSSLSRDAASGNGDVLSGLAEVLGCYSDEDRARLGDIGREKYNVIFASNNPENVLEQYLQAINQDPILAQNCTKTI